MRRRRETRKRWAQHNRRRYEVAPIDGLRVIVERAPESKIWFVSVEGVLTFGPKRLDESHIADVKDEALALVDRLLLDLRVAIGDITR